MLKSGDVVAVGGTTGTIRSIQGEVATVVVQVGSRKQLRSYPLDQLAVPGAFVRLNKEAGRLVGVLVGDSPRQPTVPPFEHFFRPRAVFEGKTGSRRTTRRHEGKLRLESGFITACDPQLAPDALPLNQRVPTGEFDVSTCRTDGRVAAAMVEFEQAPIDRWVPAWFDDETERVGAFVVDSGRACFADFEAVGSRTRRVAFGSGDGDGAYTCWWGTREDRLAALVIDFGLLSENDEFRVRFQDLGAFAKGTLSVETLEAAGVQLTFENFESRIVVSWAGATPSTRPTYFLDRHPELKNANGVSCGRVVGPARSRTSPHLRAHARWRTIRGLDVGIGGERARHTAGAGWH